MPADTTPNLFPYPISNEPVADGAQAIQNLAEAVDDHVALTKSGTVASGTLVAGTAKDVAVAFTTPFPAAGPVPTVTCAIQNGTSTAVGQPSIINVTRSGFDMRFIRPTGTATYSASWIATNVTNW